jgi:hypothetical protein
MGIARSEERETELTALCTEPASSSNSEVSGDLAAAALNSFYERMRRHYTLERQRQEARGIVPNQHKKNMQETYLDELQCAKARTLSTEFLSRHIDWCHGPMPLSQDALSARIGMQHFVSIDAEDLVLPEYKRRTCNSFDGPFENVADQFLADATRSEFHIAGEKFDFAAELEASNLSMDEDPDAVERHSEQFTARLVSALRQGLGGNPDKTLLQIVSTLMSQSGMASLERSCTSALVVVSGGEQIVRYDLTALSEFAWEIKLSMQKSGFSQAFVHESADLHAEPRLVANCLPDSIVGKSCTLRITLQDPTRILVDCIDLEDVTNLESSDCDEPESLEKPAPSRVSRLWRGSVQALGSAGRCVMVMRPPIRRVPQAIIGAVRGAVIAGVTACQRGQSRICR